MHFTSRKKHADKNRDSPRKTGIVHEGTLRPGSAVALGLSMATSKLDATAFDDLDNLPDAVTPPQASRKRTREEEVKSALRLYEYNDDFCGQSLWLHIELAPRDANGMFKPEFGAAGKVAGDSKMTKALEAAGLKLRLPG